ncbi:DNA polymerase alpha subunit B [Cajanus cajan]|uniref:DNA polymerase alpha subunit B n=1 Tax=Cajanus cajan TaxID=3821 RepID=A0A151U8Z1_CAJCA|nr:DNA polymerase alpha subunit B [Cajanus cajan]KYP75708.1 DNA polymerase alpha subunit B [Cajanus cajan]
MEEEIKSEFKRSQFDLEDEEEILRKCVTFCINYGLAPSDLVSCWEAYYLNGMLDGSIVQNAEIDGFLLHLQNQKKEDVVKEKEEAGLHMYSIADVEMILNNDDDTMDNTPGTPINHHQDLFSPAPDSTSLMYENVLSSGKPSKSKLETPFSKRTDRFLVKFNMNTVPDIENGKQEPNHEIDEDDVVRRVPSRKRCSLVIHGSGSKPNCRFMYDRLEDRLNAIENRIRKHTRAFVASGIHEEPTDPTTASQRSIFAVGMICCDGEGRLNEKSVMLQSSIEHSGGECVRLELHRLSHYSIFPGQVVCIEGHNPSGHCFIASNLVDSIPTSIADENLNPAKKQAIDKENQPTDLLSKERELSMIIAAGPFTTTDNLLFEPLMELLAYAKRRPPQLLVLLGPFVDSEHPEVKKGTVDKSFDEIFHFEILRKLEDYVECMGSARVLLVPSIRDASHDFVFPQPAFDINLPDLKSQIACLGNPGVFEANEVKVGCCTVDILKQISGEEISRTAADGKPIDRMSRLANHILNQQSFYPLYPPAEIPLDFSLAPEALQLSLVPDILILPSDIKYFVKVLSSESEGINHNKCIAVNPGRLAKGEGGGTFVELDYYGGSDQINASIVGI